MDSELILKLVMDSELILKLVMDSDLYSRPKVDIRKDRKKEKIQKGIVGRLVGNNRRRKMTY